MSFISNALLILASHKPRVNPNTHGVLAPRSGRILRYDQCALCGLTRRCSCRAPDRGFMGQRRADLAPFAGRLLTSMARLIFLCEHGSPIDQSAYDLKLKARAEQKEILFMSLGRGNDLANYSWRGSLAFPQTDSP